MLPILISVSDAPVSYFFWASAPLLEAASLKDFAPDTLLPGVKINTSDKDYAPIEQLQMQRFKGEKWELFGDIISGELSH